MKDRDRQRFGAEELAVVLSHYDIGVIESITGFDRGSRRSPKVGIVAERGKFLLKRRAPDRRSKRRLQLAHAVQLHLVQRGFPVAGLIRTKNGGATCTRLGEEIYELFEYVSGHNYSGTAEQTLDAGRTLAEFHQALQDFDVPADAPVGGYHDANHVRTALNAIPSSISSHDSVTGQEAELLGLIQRLFDEYDRAADTINDYDFASLPSGVVHADWHPGNMLYKRDQVVAVIDYDSCRVSQRILDVANALLQFSLVSGGPPDQWPDHPDQQRMSAFVEGYRRISNLSELERRCVGWLMIEALIGETVFPIARTGSFGHWTGFRFLRMVARKVCWLQQNLAEGI